MTIRNLDAVFRPRSVALIGASERAGSIGRTLLENLLGADLRGDVYAVNPRHAAVLGRPCYPDVAALPSAPDLAVIATPAATVPGIVAALAARGTRGAVVISAGFGESGPNGRALERAALEAGRSSLLRVVGPNTLGVIAPGIGLNASFAHLFPSPGGVAFVAQSGAITTSVLDWAYGRGIGFSLVAALGDMGDVDFGDMLDWLANDAATRAILLYVEAIGDARKFMSAARAAARMKPVLVVKGGRHAQSATAAASHTGRLAGPDAEYSAAFRRAGMLRVESLGELLDAVETLALARKPTGERLAIVTNGGGLGVLAADALLDRGGELAVLSAATLARLDKELPAAWSHGNPIDIVGDATAARFGQSLEAVFAEPAADAVLVLHCPTAVSTGLTAARAVAAAHATHAERTLLTSWLGEHTARAARELLEAQGVPTYETPEHAVRAFMQMVDYARNQRLLMEAPAAQPEHAAPDRETVDRIVAGARAGGRIWLTDPESRSVLAAYGIAVVTPIVADSAEQAGAAAARLGGRVVLKILAPQILHKSDVGGVVLGLEGEAETSAAASAMRERVARARPDAAIAGFTIEPLVERARGLELIVGASSGGDFGPVVLFGEGGTAVEVIGDTALELVPLNLELANALMRRTRVFRRMQGYRDVPPVDVGAVAAALTRLSLLVIDFPEIAAVDVNPLFASSAGAIALDARVQLASAAAPRRRLAICPYPRDLEREVESRDGRRFVLRPIRPEDETALKRAFARLSEEEIRARFFMPMKELPRVMAARFTQIDYDREMAFVLTDVDGSDVHAVVRLAADPDNRFAEFAIIVEHAQTGVGLGTLLMQRLIDYARGRGLVELHGDVQHDNARMLGLCRALGFVETDAGEPGVVRVSLALDRYKPQ